MELKKLEKKLIGEILLEEGYAEREEIKKALQIQKREGGLIGEIMIREGWLAEEQLMMALSKQLSLPFIQLSNYKVNRSASKVIPKEIAERYSLFPFDEDEQEIFIAMCEPENEGAMEEVRKRVRLMTQIFLATPTDIRRAIGKFYGG